VQIGNLARFIAILVLISARHTRRQIAFFCCRQFQVSIEVDFRSALVEYQWVHGFLFLLLALNKVFLSRLAALYDEIMYDHLDALARDAVHARQGFHHYAATPLLVHLFLGDIQQVASDLVFHFNDFRGRSLSLAHVYRYVCVHGVRPFLAIRAAPQLRP
jgi:hypothetical protein